MLEEIRIWHGDRNAVDTHVEFLGRFVCKKRGKTVLKIACDGSFSFRINGNLVGFGESTDFPEYKEYHTFDITKQCVVENEIRFAVWHYGEDTQTYINSPAFLAFRIEENGEVLLRSKRNILSRDDPHFRQGYRKKITVQLGFSWLYDSTAPETAFAPSEEYDVCRAHDRSICNLELRGRKPIALSETENSILIDLGRETVGFLELDLASSVRQKITVAYGEHLRAGHVAREIDGRDFSVEYIAGIGENRILIPHRRIAGRYLELYAEKLSPAEILYAGIRSTQYPIRRKCHYFGTKLDQAIYDTAVHTLHSCMHEHYEDCPWREQALYTMDSRNQMLCSYSALHGTAFQRHSLILIAKSLRKDGLLSICAPSGLDLPIPFFSLVYPIQVAEYIDHSGDRGILEEIGEVLRIIMQTFRKKIDANGLIPNFPHPCWNFYEWSKGNDHCEEPSRSEANSYEKRYDLILNCMYLHAVAQFDRIFETKTETAYIRDSIQRIFYDDVTGLYRTSNLADDFCQLGNALALLVGFGDEELADKLIRGEKMVPITLSMTTFLYDSLLMINEKKYREFVLSDIRRRYQIMLANGATTFWETELGAEDFHGAGSLCHGWSAIPIHYFCRLMR